MFIKLEKVKLPEKLECHRFIKVPLCAQETPYTCGVACTQSILAGYGIVYRQDYLSEVLKQKPIYGTDYKNIITFMEFLGFQAFFNVEMNIGLLKELIDRNITPMLILQAWKDEEIDYAYEWNSTHYVVACGYDENRIIFMDPWVVGNYTYITNDELKKRWHAPDSSGNHIYYTGLIIKHEQLQYVYDPNIIKPMD